jgi:hypothetical protein|tara:strand:+ start:233 stop:640 length:408 start_codon:yes stop_codon:yes gene_type:complete
MYSELHQVFEDALNDNNLANLDGDGYLSRLSHGIKIVKYDEDQSVVIYNTGKGGDYYNELSEKEYQIFFEHGWSKGVLTIALDRYTYKLKLVEVKIKEEINGRNNARYLEFLKNTRKETLNKYYKITQKLNQHEN